MRQYLTNPLCPLEAVSAVTEGVKVSGVSSLLCARGTRLVPGHRVRGSGRGTRLVPGHRVCGSGVRLLILLVRVTGRSPGRAVQYGPPSAHYAEDAIVFATGECHPSGRVSASSAVGGRHLARQSPVRCRLTSLGSCVIAAAVLVTLSEYYRLTPVSRRVRPPVDQPVMIMFRSAYSQQYRAQYQVAPVEDSNELLKWLTMQ